MVGRIATAAVAMVTLAPLLVHGPDPLEAAVAEDGVAFDQVSYAPGDNAVFNIRDDVLNTAGTCTATWTGLADNIPESQSWSLAAGTPVAVNFTLSAGGTFDTTTPASTPLTLPPAGQLPWVASVDGVANLVDDFNASAGEFSLLNDANAGSNVEISFYFHVVNSYTATDHRASVTSTSDPTGEWVAIGEVASETDATPSPTSALFKGQVLLSSQVAASTSGDGAVWVQPGDTLTVTHYAAGGTTSISSNTVAINAPKPAPTPIPATGPKALILLASLFTLVLAWRLRGRSSFANYR